MSKIKYIIHACRQRERYVYDFLIPAMVKQGIQEDSIYVYIDSLQNGNLFSFMKSIRFLHWYFKCDENDMVWHMQDDVAISKKFAEMTNKEYDKDIVSVFCCETYGEDLTGYIGDCTVDQMWYSFQCVGIRNKIAFECSEWFFNEVIPKRLYSQYVLAKKYDDTMFRIFVKEHYPEAKCFNLVPNLVEHVDVLIGGSIINKGLPWKRSKYWEDETVIEQLQYDLRLSERF